MSTPAIMPTFTIATLMENYFKRMRSPLTSNVFARSI